MILSQVPIARGCCARQCSLLCLAKSIPCCRARQNEHCSSRTWRMSSQIGVVLCPAAKAFQLRRSCGWGTATRGYRASMLDTNTVNKRMSLPRTNSCERQPRAIDTQLKAWTIFTRSNAGFVGSNLIQGMDVCVCLFCVYVVLCVGSGLVTGWSPVQGVLPTVYRIKNWRSYQVPTNDCRAIDKKPKWMEWQ
jgi:hypothetical protein